VRNVRRRRRAGLIQLKLEVSKADLAVLAKRGYPDMTAFDNPSVVAQAVEGFFEVEAFETRLAARSGECLSKCQNGPSG
jgi:hypothetical protein